MEEAFRVIIENESLHLLLRGKKLEAQEKQRIIANINKGLYCLVPLRELSKISNLYCSAETFVRNN